MTGLTALVFITYLATRVTVGSCPNPALVENFNPESYLGIWYELRRDKEIVFETGECVTAQYSLNDNGTVKVDNSQWFGYYDNSDAYERAIGGAQINSWRSGLLYVYFFAYLGGGYRILDTDYTSYSVVYSCDDHVTAGISFMEASWVLVRD